MNNLWSKALVTAVYWDGILNRLHTNALHFTTVEKKEIKFVSKNVAEYSGILYFGKSNQRINLGNTRARENSLH